MATVEIDPAYVFFTFSRIRPQFSCGRTVEETLEALRSGSLDVRSLPTITLLTDGKHYYSLNNRRLYCYKQLRAEGKLKTITARLKEIPKTKRMDSKYTPEKCAQQATLKHRGRRGGGGGAEGEDSSDEDEESEEEEAPVKGPAKARQATVASATKAEVRDKRGNLPPPVMDAGKKVSFGVEQVESEQTDASAQAETPTKPLPKEKAAGAKKTKVKKPVPPPRSAKKLKKKSEQWAKQQALSHGRGVKMARDSSDDSSDDSSSDEESDSDDSSSDDNSGRPSFATGGFAALRRL